MMTIPKLRKTRITRKGLVRKLDARVSEIVKERDGKCICCGTTQNLTPGHLFSRVAYSTRWDLDNCYAQCLSCNFRHEFDPYVMLDKVTALKGKPFVDALHLKYNTPHKFKDWELQELYETLY